MAYPVAGGMTDLARESGGEIASPRPLVSVIMPAYNAERYVLEAIRSVLDQSYEPIEVLLVDDGSSDGTVDLVRREAPSVRIIQQENGGAAAARNTGLRYTRGELIGFLDADDGWFPGKLAAQVDYLQRHPEVGLVFHHWLVWKPNETGVYTKQQLPSPVPGEIDPSCSGWIYPQLLLDCIVHTSTVMMRRQVFQDTGYFDQTLVNGEDYDYWLRVSRKYEIHKLTGVYSFYSEAAGSLTKTPKSENYGYRVVKGAMNQWGLSSPDGSTFIPENLARKRLGELAFGYGYQHYRSGSLRLATQAFIISLRHYSLNVKAIIFILIIKFRFWILRFCSSGH